MLCSALYAIARPSVRLSHGALWSHLGLL